MPYATSSSISSQFFHVARHRTATGPEFSRTTDYRAFLGILNHGLQCHPVRLISYCIMPNHWHLIVGPTPSPRLMALLDWVSATHDARHQRIRGTTGRLTDTGPLQVEVLEAAADLWRACQTVEGHAFRAGLVARAQDWPWCSAAERYHREPRVPLVATRFLTSDTWLSVINSRPRVAGATLPHRPACRPDSHSRDLAEKPGALAPGCQIVDDVVDVGRRADQHEAHTHVERAEHLGLADATGLLKPGKQRGDRPAALIDSEPETIRKNSRNILGEAASRDVRHPLDAPRIQE